MATGIGYLDLALVTSQIVSVGGIYVAIVIRLRKTTRKLIKSTSQSAGSSSHSHASPTVTAPKAIVAGERLDIQTSGMIGLAVFKFVSELADPIILLSMDARFRAAVRETCLWWLPGVQARLDMTSSRSLSVL
ncbi:hypothetical protein H9P43_007801 [Blastocladiella emersonii ATCC 22665]|nr:hypothetical protein H9P43_007801 [Blastocladiella emersonii ATCC 22665]